jgi:zinc protease
MNRHASDRPWRAVRRALVLVAIWAGTAAAQEVPGFAELHARFVESVGGRAALAAHASLHLQGTLTVEGLVGTLDVWRDSAGRFRQRVDLGALGITEQGYDGRTGWALQRGTPALLVGDEEAAVRRQGEWFGDITAPPEAAAAVVIAEAFEGTPAWKATYVSAEGPELALYFSRRDGRKLGYTTTTPAGESRSILADYAEFAGVWLPTKVTNRIPQGEVVLRYSTVTWDAVPPERFALPASVRALLGGGGNPD